MLILLHKQGCHVPWTLSGEGFSSSPARRPRACAEGQVCRPVMRKAGAHPPKTCSPGSRTAGKGRGCRSPSARRVARDSHWQRGSRGGAGAWQGQHPTRMVVRPLAPDPGRTRTTQRKFPFEFCSLFLSLFLVCREPGLEGFGDELVRGSGHRQRSLVTSAARSAPEISAPPRPRPSGAPTGPWPSRSQGRAPKT